MKTVLGHWALTDASSTLAAHRENKVYRIEAREGTFALRHHRHGYRTDAQLVSELQWMAVLASGGLSVPRPIAARNGALLQVIEGAQYDLLTWLPGRPLGESDVPLDLPDRTGTFHKLGQTLAQLHDISDAWNPPSDFVRPDWRQEGLLGEAPLWGRFWDSPALTPAQRSLFAEFRTSARKRLAKETFDTGLIHADLLRENVLVDGDALHLIDFDDGAWGYRLFDIVTALIKNRGEPDYPALRSALFDGYRSRRPLDNGSLALFEALRLCTYVGWIVPRTDLPDHAERTRGNIARAEATVNAYLEETAHD